MSTFTKVYTIEEIKKLEHKLQKSQCEKRKTPPYAHYQYKTSDCTITAYESGKVVFQGEGASFYVENIKQNTSSTNTFPQYGSDEVGTGDYFGPVVVCAVQIKEANLEVLKSLKIMDSKALSDAQIEEIAPVLMKELVYSHLILDNVKYNQVHEHNNMNAIKAKLHNKAYVHLQNKVQTSLSNIIVDQFTPEKNYYTYIKDEPIIINNIHFETKAENKYLSVACASIIARYYFLLYFKKLSAHYEFDFPKGAGSNVDEKAKQFVLKYGWDEMYKVCKLHFKNSDKVKETVL